MPLEGKTGSTEVSSGPHSLKITTCRDSIRTSMLHRSQGNNSAVSLVLPLKQKTILLASNNIQIFVLSQLGLSREELEFITLADFRFATKMRV